MITTVVAWFIAMEIRDAISWYMRSRQMEAQKKALSEEARRMWREDAARGLTPKNVDEIRIEHHE